MPFQSRCGVPETEFSFKKGSGTFGQDFKSCLDQIAFGQHCLGLDCLCSVWSNKKHWRLHESSFLAPWGQILGISILDELPYHSFFDLDQLLSENSWAWMMCSPRIGHGFMLGFENCLTEGF